MRLAVLGCGYVGTVVAGAFARLGHDVTGIEIDESKLDQLRSGRAPFHEPQLDVLIRHGLARGSLSFTSEAAEAVGGADVIFLCLASPDGGDGRADLRQLQGAVAAIAPHLRRESVVVVKSTLPVGTHEWLAQELRDRSGLDVPVVVNPEFLREGAAVEDFLHPDRIVLGGRDPRAVDIVRRVYQPILEQSFERVTAAADRGVSRPHLVITSSATAEVVKYAANTFLASRISLINEISQICDALGADVEAVAKAVGLDRRIGPDFLRAGLGWGGSCFEKDLAIFARQARDAGVEPRLIEAAGAANRWHRRWVLDKVAAGLGGLAGRSIAVLGLAFKPGTDDVRDSPALELIERLAAAGANVRVHDPAVSALAAMPGIEICSEPIVAAAWADALVLATDWPEYARLDLHGVAAAMQGTLVVDTRNMWDPQDVAAAGLEYQGIGRQGAPAATYPRRPAAAAEGG